MAAQISAIPLPLRAEGRGRSSLLAYGSKSSATTPLCTILIHFPRGSRSLSPLDDLEITLPRFPAFIATRYTNATRQGAKSRSIVAALGESTRPRSPASRLPLSAS